MRRFEGYPEPGWHPDTRKSSVVDTSRRSVAAPSVRGENVLSDAVALKLVVRKIPRASSAQNPGII